VFHLPFLDATAEYHRSDESSGSCAGSWVWSGDTRGARGTGSDTGGGCASGYRGFTRGWAPMIRGSLAGKPARRPETPDCSTPLLARRHRPRPGAVCRLAFRRGDGRASSVELASPWGWQASFGVALSSGSESPLAWWRVGPELLRGFLLRVPDGPSSGKPRTSGTDDRSQSRPRRLPRAGCLTEVSPGAQDTQRERDDTSHGVRFLSARRAPARVVHRFT
jgi:hypothetical protein